ncbi:GH12 family glycosyl hydrolase domain-containing protein [Metallosphaera cuprina]|uniref:Cellulase (Endo 1,4 beta glucanase), putative (CelB) n=1 Tax=Metallosphaera cuprina (strain Ar-4) TaxID=1006006 RepID=F4G2P2_METCR|nr:cellulase [Metallosphaera cuprina]AEB95090.1 cellulase (endo 1,4 beta glucanase), putative (celB) [Metallosphaera cuprina Ar-4]
MKLKIVFAIAIIIIVLVSFSAYWYSRTSHNEVNVAYTKPTDEVKLFPTQSRGFSLIGSYLSDSRYGMAQLYGQSSSLMASPFLWNVKEGEGQVTMNFSNYLKVVINMSKVNKITPSIPVDGYPGLMYGREMWFPFVAQTETYRLNLPEIVNDLPSFYSILNYSIFVNEGTVDDFSYDIWLSQNPNITYLKYGDFEVMIWLYWHENFSSDKYMIYTGEMTIPVEVNGTFEPMNFSVYVLPRTGSADGWTGVYLLAPRNLQGSVGVPIAYVLNNMSPYLSKVKINIYNTSKYYLDAIQVGMEFNDISGTADLGYSLYSWTLTFGNATA